MKNKKEPIKTLVLIIAGIIFLIWFFNILYEPQITITKEVCEEKTYDGYVCPDNTLIVGIFDDYDGIITNGMTCWRNNETFTDCHEEEVDGFYILNKFDVTVKIDEEVLSDYPQWLDENCECVGVYDKDKKEKILCGENEKHLCRAFTNRPKYFECSKYKWGEYFVEVER